MKFKILLLGIAAYFSCISCMAIGMESKKGGIIEISLPDSLEGSIMLHEMDSKGWKTIDSSEVVNGKYIFKYAYRESPQFAALHFVEKDGTKQIIWVSNPYYTPPTPGTFSTRLYGNIILDNTHIMIHFQKQMKGTYLSCNYETKPDSASSDEGCLDVTFPDSITGHLYMEKSENMQFIPLDSTQIINGKCTFHYNQKEIPSDWFRFVIRKNHFGILLPEDKGPKNWNDLMKNGTHIKAVASWKTINNGVVTTVSGSPETDIQLQLMANHPECHDSLGYISDSYIRKHPESKLLLDNIFYDRTRYSSVTKLKQVFSLFNENVRMSMRGKELITYIEETEEYEKFGISRSFIYYDISGKPYTFKDCIGDKRLCVIVFWASWCGPCLQEIPHLRMFYQEYKNKVALVSLSIDENYKAWADRMKQYPVDWLNLSGLPDYKTKVKDNYGITSIPCFMIVDSKGKIVASQYIADNNGNMHFLGLEDIKQIINEE